MNRFQHHPDGIIFINEHGFPLDWWLTQEPGYSGLPEGAIGRLYVPTKRHHITIMKGDTPSQFPGEIDEHHLWAEGDGYISKLQDYIDAYELFINPPPPPLTLPEYKLKAIETNQIEAGRRIALLFGTTYGTNAMRDKQANNMAEGVVLTLKVARGTNDAADDTRIGILSALLVSIDAIRSAENTTATLIDRVGNRAAVDAMSVSWP